MAKRQREQLQDANVREDVHEQIPGQLSFATEAAMTAWAIEVAQQFVFAPALVVPVVDHARVVNINSRR